MVAVRDALDVPYQFEYAGEHLMVRHTDRNGLSFFYSHRLHDDGVWRADHAWGDGGLYDYRFEYDTTRLETRITDSLGHVTRLQMNERGFPVSSTDPLGGVTSYRYDDLGRTREEIGPTGLRTKWDYDAYGNLIAHTFPDRSAVRTKYDDAHRAVEVTDPEGGKWQQTWDAQGNLVKQITPSGVAAGFAYDRAGQLVRVTDADQRVTTLDYDLLGNLASLTDAVGRMLRFEHDQRGNLVQRESPGEDATAYIWNQKDRLVACELPGGRYVRCEYDPADNLTKYTDEAGQVSAFTYYGQGHLASRTDPDGSVTRYHYDTEEQLVGVSNPLGQVWKLKRDAKGQLVEEVDYFGKSRRYTYNLAGHLAHTMDPLGQVLAIQCDALGRITSRRDEKNKDAEEQYKYNRRGQLVEARNMESTVKRRYDADGRLVQEAQERGDVRGRVDYLYDPAGQLKLQKRELASVTGDACYQQTLTYDYDALGQAQTLQIDKHEPIQFARDMAGRLSNVRFNAGLDQGFKYDRSGRLSRLSMKRAGHREEQTAYRYDVSGNLIERSDSRLGVDKYRYDPLGRIIAHTDPAERLRHFAYDAHGDRFKVVRDDDQGRVSRHDDGALWHSDAAGQLVLREGREHGVQRFEWDAFGRLKRFENTRNERWAYRYDALGRRIGKQATEAWSGTHSQQGSQTWFLWDGDAIAGELRKAPSTQLSGHDQTDHARFYAYHLGSFEPLVMQTLVRNGSGPAQKAESTLFFYQNDVNGAPVRLRAESGDVVWEGHYSVTGGVDHLEARGIDQPIRLQGQYFDEESNLHYNRHRYFDPNTGYFISQDPIGLHGGENPYRFSPNVFGWIDPWGLEGKKKPPAPGRPTPANTGGLFVPGPGSGHYKFWPAKGKRSSCKGWRDKKGDIWEPTDHNGTHGPHWDVQHSDGTHTPTYPVD